MKQNFLTICSVLGLLISPMASNAQTTTTTLKPGDPAPKLEVSKWAQGQPVSGFESGKVYIVEFWATWCGPCIATIPHLNALHEKFKDRGVVVIGQNVMERQEDLVPPFIAKMGTNMTYRVALDDKSRHSDGAMLRNWMEAAGQNGIPTAFIVNKQGKIAWIGHPMTLKESVLEDILADRFDIAQAAADAEREQRNRAVMIDLSQKLGLSLQKRNWDEADSIVNELEKLLPENQRDGIALMRFQILIGRKDYPAAYRLADSLADKEASNPLLLNELAWAIATRPGLEQRDLRVAERLAVQADKTAEGKSAGILDTVARIQFMTGRKTEAIATMKKAIAVAEEEEKPALQRALSSYEQDKLPSAGF